MCSSDLDWNRLQETVAVSILGITQRADAAAADSSTLADRGGHPGGAGSRFDLVAPDVMADWLGRAGLSTSSLRLDRRRLHPHHLLTGRRTTPVG